MEHTSTHSGYRVPGLSPHDLALQGTRRAKRLPGTASIDYGSRFLHVTLPLMGERPDDPPESESEEEVQGY